MPKWLLNIFKVGWISPEPFWAPCASDQSPSEKTFLMFRQDLLSFTVCLLVLSLGITERKLSYFFRTSLQILSHWWNLPRAFSSSDWTLPALVTSIYMLFVVLFPLHPCLIHQSCTEHPKTVLRLHVWPQNAN